MEGNPERSSVPPSDVAGFLRNLPIGAIRIPRRRHHKSGVHVGSHGNGSAYLRHRLNRGNEATVSAVIRLRRSRACYGVSGSLLFLFAAVWLVMKT